MFTGTLLAIFVASEAGAPMRQVEEARAVPGRGLEGDRYFRAAGRFSRWPGPHREVTLVAAEALEEMARETGVVLSPSESRRNLLVRGVPLAELFRREFTVGPVRLRGITSCEPCGYLARLVGRPEVRRALAGRGGLRAQLLTEGTLRAGDPVRPADW